MMDMQFEADTPPANIKVIGVGGGGGNAVQNMNMMKETPFRRA